MAARSNRKKGKDGSKPLDASSDGSQSMPELPITTPKVSPRPTDACDIYEAKTYSLEQKRFKVEILTLAIAIVFLGLAIWQWDQTGKATKAAQDAVEVARQAMELDQRPWVTVNAITLREPFGEGKPNYVEFTYTNSGNTPAMNVIVTANSSDATPWPLPDRMPVFQTVQTGGITIPRELLPVGIELKRGGDIPARTDVQKLAAGAAVFNVMGTILYQDVLKKWHLTHFCYHLPNVRTNVMVLCPNNNYAEDVDLDANGQPKE